MNYFVVDVLLQKDEICNQTDLRAALWERVLLGKKLALIGRRNTGKTSIVRNDTLAQFSEKFSRGLAVYVDLMDVASEDDFSRRLQRAFEKGVSNVRPTRSFLDQVAKSLTSLRPSIRLDPHSGTPTIELGFGEKKPIHFADLIEEIGRYHLKDRAVIVFDEFQDISFIKALPAKLRRCLQELPADLSVVASGSKAHILRGMFGHPKAAFASWGEILEIKEIELDEYFAYAQDRFVACQLTISKPAFHKIMQLMQGIPESINIVCNRLCRTLSKGDVIDESKIFGALGQIIDERQSIFRDRLRRYTEKEIHFLRAMAVSQPVSQPTKREFLELTQASLGGVQAMIKRLENEGMIYRLEQGYVVDDSLLARFLIAN
jgi:hypothetical protein